jgi:hypothetical protein
VPRVRVAETDAPPAQIIDKIRPILLADTSRILHLFPALGDLGEIAGQLSTIPRLLDVSKRANEYPKLLSHRFLCVADKPWDYVYRRLEFKRHGMSSGAIASPNPISLAKLAQVKN